MFANVFTLSTPFDDFKYSLIVATPIFAFNQPESPPTLLAAPAACAAFATEVLA